MASRRYRNYFNSGRGGGIRTHDPLLPKQMRYQAALRPEEARILQTERAKVNRTGKKTVAAIPGAENNVLLNALSGALKMRYCQRKGDFA